MFDFSALTRSRHGKPWRRLVVFMAAATLPWAHAGACGYDGAATLDFAGTSIAFADLLAVRNAIWRAQIDGRLPSDTAPAAATKPLPSFAAPLVASPGVDPTRIAALVDALRSIEQARRQMADADRLNEQPALAMAFASTMLWTRLVPTDLTLVAQTHASGPQPGDAILLTELPVLQALLAGKLTVAEGFSRGLLRLYGDEAALEPTRRWLAALEPATRQESIAVDAQQSAPAPKSALAGRQLAHMELCQTRQNCASRISYTLSTNRGLP